MDVMFVNAEYNGKVELNDEAVNYLSKFNKIALYGAIQFSNKLDKILEQLGNRVITSKPDRTNGEYQILGCDLSLKNLNLKEKPDVFLYIGDGIFHPRALVLSQKDESNFIEVIRYDPIANQMSKLGLDDVDKILKKYKGSLMKFLSADVVGVLITTKPGQQQFKVAKKLKEKFKEKNFYYFVDNNINFNELENFQFIECWVNSACPRIGFDDNAHIEDSIVNLTDALNIGK